MPVAHSVRGSYRRGHAASSASASCHECVRARNSGVTPQAQPPRHATSVLGPAPVGSRHEQRGLVHGRVDDTPPDVARGLRALRWLSLPSEEGLFHSPCRPSCHELDSADSGRRLLRAARSSPGLYGEPTANGHLRQRLRTPRRPGFFQLFPSLNRSLRPIECFFLILRIIKTPQGSPHTLVSLASFTSH